MKSIEYISLIVLCLVAIVLIALQIHVIGWFLFLFGISTLFLCRRKFAKDFLLIYLSLGILGFTPITTDVSYVHFFQMGMALALAVAIPYLISRFIYKDHLVRFKFHHGRTWYKTEILYIFLTAIIAYFLLPFYFKTSNAYLNWNIELGTSNIVRLFIGTNALGIWDELFFISTVLGILRRYITFTVANLVQAVLFTSFLYELGFTGWGFIMIFIFALIQGYIFKKTESLFYVITIHLTLDFILFLALIYMYYPHLMPIFLF